MLNPLNAGDAMYDFLVISGFFILAIVFMASALHFSRFKGKKSGCCGSSLFEEESGKDATSCVVCPKRAQSLSEQAH